MLLRSTCRPSAWPPATTQATSSVTSDGDTSQHALHAANIEAMSYYFPAFHCHRQTPASCSTWQPLSHKHQLTEQQMQTPCYNLPSTNEGSPSWYRASQAARSIIVQPRSVDCHGADLQVAPEKHSRPSWDPIHYLLLFSYGTDGFHLDIPKDSKGKSVTAMEYYCWRLMQSDGRAWTSCCAATDCSSSTLSTPVRKWNSSG